MVFGPAERLGAAGPRPRTRALTLALALLAFALASVVGVLPAQAGPDRAYVANFGDATVSVIGTGTER